MDCHDYTDTHLGPTDDYSDIYPNEIVYKLNPRETQELVKLRMSNKCLFNGKRNASMCGWRAILRHMGLHEKMTHYQAAKKWENMKKRYKEIKLTPQGAPFPQWPFYTLMNDAMEGRLDGSAPVVLTTQQDRFQVLNGPKRRKRRLLMPTITSVESMAPVASPESYYTGPEVEVTLNGMDPEEEGLDIRNILQEVNIEKQVMEQQKQMMEREQLLLQRERAALDREVASLERDRASVDRDRAAIERERALLDRERAVMEKEKEAVARERLALEQEKARLVRGDSDSGNTDSTDRRERFLFMFETLINTL